MYLYSSFHLLLSRGVILAYSLIINMQSTLILCLCLCIKQTQSNIGIPCSYHGQEEIHLKFCHSSTQTRPDPITEWHRPKRVMLDVLHVSAEPSLRFECVRVGKDALVVGHSVVAQVKQRL